MAYTGATTPNVGTTTTNDLLRDITLDMQLALEEFSNRSTDFAEVQESHARS